MSWQHTGRTDIPLTARGEANYRQPDAWSRRAIVNVGHSDKFFSDRTIMEYARSIWSAEACPVDQS
ncbi:MAG: glycogen/starch/alpha-glucan phosphorylase [Isosphaeraceae bacterium]